MGKLKIQRNKEKKDKARGIIKPVKLNREQLEAGWLKDFVNQAPSEETKQERMSTIKDVKCNDC
jgi:hypothetical protein